MPRRGGVDPQSPEWLILRRLIIEASIARQDAGLSQRQVGKATHYSQSGISAMESLHTPYVSLMILIRYWLALGYDDIRIVPVRKEKRETTGSQDRPS